MLISHANIPHGLDEVNIPKPTALTKSRILKTFQILRVLMGKGCFVSNADATIGAVIPIHASWKSKETQQ